MEKGKKEKKNRGLNFALLTRISACHTALLDKGKKQQMERVEHVSLDTCAQQNNKRL